MFPVIKRVPRESFKKILTEGQKISSGLFLMRKMKNNAEKTRASVVVSKKVAILATKRNLIKRRFMQAMRENAEKYRDYDCLIFVQPKSSTATFAEISKEVKNVL